MVAEAFDEDRDSKLERFWVRVKGTWVGQRGAELGIFEKLKQLLYELGILQEFIKESFSLGDFLSGLGVISKLNEFEDLEIIGELC